MIGAVVPTFFMYGAFLYKYFTTGHYTPGGVACRSIYVFCILAAFATMMPNMAAPDTLAICGTYKDEASCNAFLQNGEQCDADDGHREIHFRCGWKAIEYTPTQQILIPEAARLEK